jgi:Basic region leucine zipper
MHARKTRQRKKEPMQTLQQSLDELKEEQMRLRQIINEKNTANILVGLFSSSGTNGVPEDPDIEMLLRRPAEEIPDASKIPELPALILPGQHNSKKAKGQNPPSSTEYDLDDDSHPQHQLIPDDGIDYALLGKDRSMCTPDELDQIRRERNRMHAKRTRDRKRLLMEAMEKIIKKLEDENALLLDHLQSLGVTESALHLVSPNLISATPPPKLDQPPAALLNIAIEAETLTETPQDRKQLVNQLKCLLVAAGTFEGEDCQTAVSSTVMTTVSTSAEISGESSCSEDDAPEPKRRKLGDGPFSHAIAI